MNIKSISNHIAFDSIFETHKDKESGKILWQDIVKSQDLPTEFIDTYFHQLKQFKLERFQDLNEFLIKKYSHFLNWYTFVKFRKIPTNILYQNIQIIRKLKLFGLLLRYQNLDYNFIIDFFNELKGIKNFEILIKSQLTNFTDKQKQKILNQLLFQ